MTQLTHTSDKVRAEFDKLRVHKIRLEAIERGLSLSVNWNHTDSRNISSHLAELQFLYQKHSETDPELLQSMRQKLKLEYNKLQVVTLRNRLQRLQDCVGSLSIAYLTGMNSHSKTYEADRVRSHTPVLTGTVSDDNFLSNPSFQIERALETNTNFRTPQKFDYRIESQLMSPEKPRNSAGDLTHGQKRNIRSLKEVISGSHDDEPMSRPMRRFRELTNSQARTDFKSTAAHSLTADIVKSDPERPLAFKKYSRILPHYLGAISQLIAKKAGSRSHPNQPFT